MDKQERKRLAEASVDTLADIILDVLSEAGDCIGPAEISKRGGIYRSEENMNDGITSNILRKLEKAGRVKPCDQSSGKRGWELT